MEGLVNLFCFGITFVVFFIFILYGIITAFTSKEDEASISPQNLSNATNSIQNNSQIAVTTQDPVCEYKYKSREFLMTQSELRFYQSLNKAVRQKYVVMSKVALMDIVKTNEYSYSRKGAAFNKIRGKHIDFVLIDPSNSEIKYAIELDDFTHSYKKSKEKDIFKDFIFEHVGIPLVRFSNCYATVENIIERLSVARL